MSLRWYRAALTLSCAFGITIGVGGMSAYAKPPSKPKKATLEKAGGAKTEVTALVMQFEKAYQRKDKVTMIKKLMTPNPDDLMVEKRYQWLQGYGPKDMPGSKHPPILFERPRGTFVPTAYTLRGLTPGDATHYVASVTEKGTYTDEDGKYKVERIRQIKCRKVGAKWYIEDYPAPSEDDLGFGVDDIKDKMTKI